MKAKRNRTEYNRTYFLANRVKWESEETKAAKTKWRQADVAKDPEKYRRLRFERNLKQYGLTVEAFEAIIAKQGNVCAACGKPFGDTKSTRPAVDHDHATGEVRGILHNSCNRYIGLFNDDPSFLRRAADYLERNFKCAYG